MSLIPICTFSIIKEPPLASITCHSSFWPENYWFSYFKLLWKYNKAQVLGIRVGFTTQKATKNASDAIGPATLYVFIKVSDILGGCQIFFRGWGLARGPIKILQYNKESIQTRKISTQGTYSNKNFLWNDRNIKLFECQSPFMIAEKGSE